ncbi:MAG: hypothetical protein PHC74_00020 [Sulfurimonas sp.]|nr:hypothetical protein [Sulfurimonas sp.]
MKVKSQVKENLIRMIIPIIIFVQPMLYMQFSITATFILSLSFAFVYILFSIYKLRTLVNNEERNLMMSMWKMYFSVIMIMLGFSSAYFFHGLDLINERNKTQLDYALKVNSKDANESLQKYINDIDKYIDFFMPKPIIKSVKTSSNESDKKYTVWYINLSLTIMIMMSQLMLYRLFTEFNKNASRLKIKIFT